MTRIERAARAKWAHEMASVPFNDLAPHEKADLMVETLDILRAAEPELYADPPRAWRAPIDATEAMIDAAVHEEAYRPSRHWEGPPDVWAAMRDAHLKDAPQ